MTRRQLLARAALALGSARQASAQPPARRRRADSYFGLHFDLHPQDKDTALGRDVSEAMVEKILAVAKPDFVQYDAKGHAGWVGWPSKVGPSSPGIVKDSLAVWRKVTAQRGVSLYIHFSGVWDSEAVRRHPEWARGTVDGRKEERQTSTFGPYVDELMLPQLREVATLHDLDGVWVDGECWATGPDYSPLAVAAWKKATGRPDPPKDKSAPDWQEWLEFNREQFRWYVRHYVDELHRTHPKFQVASNWLYSTYVPEKPTLPVDFLSGDYLGNAAISKARLEARYLEATGKPWDLMAWGFQQAQSNAIGHVHKPAVQLQQEASVVLSRGGGFQVYYVPTRAGYFEESHIAVMGKIASFCRERQSVSHKTRSLSTMAVLFSKDTLYRTTSKLFGGWGHASAPAEGWLDALLACHYSVDVLPDWQLGDASSQRYSVVVCPDWSALGEGVRDQLIERVKAGMTLVVAGAENAALFAPAMGVSLTGAPNDQPAFLPGGEVLGNAKGLWQEVSGGTVMARRYEVMDSRGDGKPAAVSARAGQGEIVLIPGPIGGVYASTHAPAIRDFVARLMMPRAKPAVTISAPPTVEMSLRQKGERGMLLHLLNTTGMQVAGDYSAVDFIPAVGPIEITALLPQAPGTVRVVPGGRGLAGKWEGGRWKGTLDSLHLHTVIAFEMA